MLVICGFINKTATAELFISNPAFQGNLGPKDHAFYAELNLLIETFEKRPLLPNLGVRLKF